MPSAITKLGIVNRGLQLLGQPSVSSLTENSRSARAMARAYDSILLSALEEHVWNFSVRRASLAADPTPPIFGKSKYFPLPNDFIYLAPDETTTYDPRRRDYNIETFNNTLCIVSDQDGPLPIRYVSSNVTEGMFSATFAEVMAYDLAEACCEEITNSNTKLQNLMRGKDAVLRTAKRRNDLQNAPVRAPTVTWISVRD